MKKLIFILALSCIFTLCWAPQTNVDLSIRKTAYDQIQKEIEYRDSYNSAIDKLKEFEGLQLVPYQDSHGLAVGYGHVILSYESFEKISKETAEELLFIDFDKAILKVEQYTGLNRFEDAKKVLALAHFVFQFGEGAFANSTLRQNVLTNQSIAGEIIRWTHATINGEKKSLPSLEKRRQYELKLYYS